MYHVLQLCTMYYNYVQCAIIYFCVQDGFSVGEREKGESDFDA